jgi:ABC-type multidrug transport system permease subunit
VAYEADTAVSGILFLLSGWYDCIYHAVCDSAGLYDACVCRLFGAQIGFFLPVYAGLLFVLALFATAFALFLNMLFAQKVTANMLGSALAVLASIISGGFYEVAHEGGILDTIASMLMTKAVLQLSESLEAGLTAQAVEHLGFVLLWASALFIATLLVQWMHKTAAD